jgi:hypothetical protein
VVKTQVRTILIGTLLAFIPVGTWLGIGFLRPINFSPYLFLPLVLFPLSIGYTILRFRFLRTDDLVKRGATYLLLTAFVMLGYAVIVTGCGRLAFQCGTAFQQSLSGGRSDLPHRRPAWSRSAHACKPQWTQSFSAARAFLKSNWKISPVNLPARWTSTPLALSCATRSPPP